MINDIFRTILAASLQGGILVIALVFIKIIFKNKISPRVYCVLWLMIFAKLILTPFAPQSNLSLFNAEKYMGSNIIQKNTTPIVNSFSDGTAIQSEIHKDSSFKKTLQTNYTTDKLSQQSSPSVKKDEVMSVSNKKSEKLNIYTILSAIWFIGFLTVIFTMLLARFIFIKRVRISKSAVNQESISKINSFYHTFKIEEDMPVFICSCIDVPCVFGILKPEILIPQKLITDKCYQETAYMLMHEMAHIKRKDNLINVITLILNAIHWFNPIIWCAHKQLNIDREVCCDLYALEQLRAEESVSYGMVLINFSSLKRKSMLAFGVSGFYKTFNSLERRIRTIKNFKKGSYKISAGATAICMAIGFLTLTNPALTSGAANKSVSVTQSDISYSKFNIDSSGDKEFNSLERAKRFIALNFKVPDFIPAGYSFNNLYLNEKAINNENEVILQFTTDEMKAQAKGKNMQFLYISASKGNILDSMKSKESMYSTYTVTKKAMKIGNVNGIFANSEWKYKNQSEDTSVYDNPVYSAERDFVWQDNGIWYDIKFYSYSIDKVNNNSKNTSYVASDISLNDLEKVVASFKDYKEVSHSKYVYQNNDYMEIYDQDDLKEAKSLLGFSPSLSRDLPGGYLLHSADVSPVAYKTSYGSDLSKDTKKTVELYSKYCLKNKLLKIENTVYVSQRKAFQSDNSLINSKYITEKNYKTNKLEKIPVKFMEVNNIKVLTYEDFSSDNIADSNYEWIKNNIYYSVTMSPSIKNKDEIIRALVTQ